MFQKGKESDQHQIPFFSLWNSLEIAFVAACTCSEENSNLILFNKDWLKNHEIQISFYSTSIDWRTPLFSAKNTKMSQVGTQSKKAKTQIILFHKTSIYWTPTVPNWMIIKGDKYLKLTRICVIAPQ